MLLDLSSSKPDSEPEPVPESLSIFVILFKPVSFNGGTFLA